MNPPSLPTKTKAVNWLKQAQILLNGVRGQPLHRPIRQQLAVKLASLLLLGSQKEGTWREKLKSLFLSKFLKHDRSKKLAVALSDQSFRSQQKKRIEDQIRYLVGRSIPFLLPVLKALMRTVILPGERKPLMRELRKKEARGVTVNLNRLGEAILSESEALQRSALYCEDLAQEEISSISIKISTLYSQIHQIAWEHSLEQLALRLRLLYRTAMQHLPHKMITLDMEAYHDLPLTFELFQRVLSEPEFKTLSAGIVLQAYIPESFVYQQKLTIWAQKRVKLGGAPIKLRIVKGANLKMEQVEASLYGWPQAPYLCKAEVDANFKRMVEYALEEGRTLAVRIGIASHNLFDIAYALVLRAELNVEDHVLFEMLEGMAPAQQRALQQITGSLLLYCPASRKKEFAYGMAYLIRRLDEN
ncbi:MAG: proline dehydrogenase family protein, partial [Verrucomicrobia bacterium]|nr:proline dehydrogenase family protein [Verrucomicrobiota bacterium]